MSLENLANRCFRFSSDNSTDVFKTFKHICRIVARKPCQKICQISLTISGKHWPSQGSRGPEFWLSTKIKTKGMCASEIVFILNLFLYLNLFFLLFIFKLLSFKTSESWLCASERAQSLVKKKQSINIDY